MPWRCLCRRSRRREWAPASALVLAAEAIVHTDANIAAKRRVSDRVLIFFVEEICHAGIYGDSAAEIVTTRKVEAGVAGISPEARPEPSACYDKAQEVAVCPRAAEVSGEIHVHSPNRRIQNERSGMGRTANEPITRNQCWVAGMRGLKTPALAELAIPHNAPPSHPPGLDRHLSSS